MQKNILIYILIASIFIFLNCQIQYNLDDLLKDAVISDKLNSPTPETLTIPQPQKPWTIMVYMDGDNDLSPATEYDLYEMLYSGGSNTNVNIVALVDQKPNTGTYGGGNKHGIYYVGHTKFFLVQDMPELDTGEGMGTLNTANFFLNFVNTYFKADHYMFIFWNHGSGVDRSILSTELTFPPRNIGLDTTQTSGDTTLTEVEQKSIIQSLKTLNGNVNVDIVGYDACLMGMAEIMYQMRDIADYFVASEDNIPGAGYDYSFISQIRDNPLITALEIGQHIVNYYADVYQNFFYYDYVTLSFIDLSYIGGSESQDLGWMINDFGNAAIASGSSQKAYYLTIRNSLDRFPYHLQSYSYFYDLYEFMNAVNANTSIDITVKTKANNIMTLISGSYLVKYSYKGVSHTDTADANGISIYIGPTTTAYKNNHDMLDGVTGPNTSWDEFLEWVGF